MPGARRSIRRFTGQPVEQEKIDLLLEAALRSPSSKGNTPWQFMVVQDRQRLNQLAVAKAHGATFLKNAPLAIVICADPSQSDVWVEDASIATTLIHLEATDLGLGSCWVQIRLRQREDQSSSQEFLAELLGLPAAKSARLQRLLREVGMTPAHPLAAATAFEELLRPDRRAACAQAGIAHAATLDWGSRAREIAGVAYTLLT